MDTVDWGQVEKDRIFSALSDQSRRKIIELLNENDATLLELNKFFPFSFQALSKHIKVLDDAGIINKRREGKYRILSLNRQALDSSLEWIGHYFEFWNYSFDRLQVLIQKRNNDRRK